MNQMPNYWSGEIPNAHQQLYNYANLHMNNQIQSQNVIHGSNHVNNNANQGLPPSYEPTKTYSRAPGTQTALRTTTSHHGYAIPSQPLTRSASKRHRSQNTYDPLQADPKLQQQQQMPTQITTKNQNFRPIPFYDQICEIIPPTILRSENIVNTANESQIEFRLSIDMADAVAMHREKTHIVLRFCYIDPFITEQDDNFPPDITINVNGKPITLPPAIANPNRPGVPAKRPGQYVDITNHCKLCPFATNQVNIKWYVDPTDITKIYACTMTIGEKQSIETLLNRIKLRGSLGSELIKKMVVDSDNEVATTNLQCSLLCPLGKMRMTAPCKSIKCKHIPCFDAATYLQMNEKKATWNCPVCFKPAYYEELQIDGYFEEVLANTSSNITEVTLNLDGSWSPVLKTEQPSSAKCNQLEIITISDDDDDEG